MGTSTEATLIGNDTKGQLNAVHINVGIPSIPKLLPYANERDQYGNTLLLIVLVDVYYELHSHQLYGIIVDWRNNKELL